MILTSNPPNLSVLKPQRSTIYFSMSILSQWGLLTCLSPETYHDGASGIWNIASQHDREYSVALKVSASKRHTSLPPRLAKESRVAEKYRRTICLGGEKSPGIVSTAVDSNMGSRY